MSRAFWIGSKRVFCFMERYSVIRDKHCREIVLLRGRGCAYRKCAFCDYHTDCSPSDEDNFAVNSAALSRVTGEYKEIEIINSGSVFELDERTLELIKDVCRSRGIGVIHFEAHYMYKDRLERLRRDFCEFELKLKLGVETFDRDLRERVWNKGIPDTDPEQIARGFDEANFLFGVSGQTEESMRRDITLGLENFERICINIMCKNSTHVLPDRNVIKTFVDKIYGEYAFDPRVDILINNTDFGVGE